MYWLNVDKPTCISRLHKAGCYKPNETDLKGKEVEKRDGGWFEFDSVANARQFQETRFPKAMIVPCKLCRPF